jgi:hypothetical protein
VTKQKGSGGQACVSAVSAHRRGNVFRSIQVFQSRPMDVFQNRAGLFDQKRVTGLNFFIGLV